MNDFLEQFFGFSQQVRLGVYVGVAVLLSLLYWHFSYSPNNLVLNEKRSKVEELEAQKAKKYSMVAQLEVLRQQVKELDIKLKEAIQQLPDQKEIPDLLSTVSSLGRESGLEIPLFRQKPETLQDFYAEVPVEMNMRGYYGQLVEFFRKVGSLSRIVNVKDIAIRNPQVKSDIVVVDSACTAVTFRFLTDEERARIAAEKARQQQK
jgi:type IV pilus assembly protein PilO